MKGFVLDVLFRILMLGANLLAFGASLFVVPEVPSIRAMLDVPDTGLIWWAVELVVTFFVFNLVALGLYKLIKQGLQTGGQSAPGREARARRAGDFRKGEQQPDLAAQPPGIVAQGIDFEQEVATLFGAMYPIKAKVDNPRKGKINCKLYDANGALAGVVQVSPDNEAATLGPDALRTLNAYKAKSGVPRALLVS